MKRVKVLKRVSVVVGLILLVGIIVLLILERVPIEKKYSLEDVEENQAVAVLFYYDYGITKVAIVTKSGRWKCTDMTDMKNENMSHIPQERKNDIELVDEILSDKKIPFQNTTLHIDDRLMKNTINFPKIHTRFRKKTYNSEFWNRKTFISYNVFTGTGKDRKIREIGRKGDGARYRFDINIMMMIHKLDQLEAMRKEVME